MADVWVNGLKVVLRSQWTPEFKQEIGETVLNALFSQIQENHDLPKVDFDKMDSKEWLEYMGKPNSHNNATITVNTN